MREAIHEILTDVSDSFSNMIDMALANEIRVRNPQLWDVHMICSSSCVQAGVKPEVGSTHLFDFWVYNARGPKNRITSGLLLWGIVICLADTL